MMSSSSSRPKSRPVSRRERPIATAFLNFGGGGGKTTSSSGAYVCVDCGYVFKGDFAALPRSYRCPTCNVGKNRFKPVGGGSVLAQKKANKEAFRARRAAADKKGRLTGREALKQKMIDAQRENDQKRRGWF